MKKVIFLMLCHVMVILLRCSDSASADRSKDNKDANADSASTDSFSADRAKGKKDVSADSSSADSFSADRSKGNEDTGADSFNADSSSTDRSKGNKDASADSSSADRSKGNKGVKNNVEKQGARVYNITVLETELHNEIIAMALEMETLKEYRRTCEMALVDTTNTLDLNKECLKQEDIFLIKKCQSSMKRAVNKARAQMKKNQAAQDALEINARRLNDSMYYIPGTEDIDTSTTIPESFARYTQTNIVRSQKKRAASERLRCQIYSHLLTCAIDMWNMSNDETANDCFNTGTDETIDASNNLQDGFIDPFTEDY